MKKQTAEEKGRLGGIPHIVGNIIGIAMIVLLLPILLVNMTLIIKSYTKPNEVPNFMGVCPLIVESGSMCARDPETNKPIGPIFVNDLIITKRVDYNSLKAGDIIAFQPSVANKVVTHRIVAINEDGSLTTKGDANNTPDGDPVRSGQVVGLYFQRFPGIGKIAKFLQQPVGMVLCVAVPLALFLLYDVLRRFLYNLKNKKEKDAEQEELERLRALAASIEKGEIPAEFVPPADAAPAPPAEYPAFVPPAFVPPVFVPIEEEPAAPTYPPVEGEDFEEADET